MNNTKAHEDVEAVLAQARAAVRDDPEIRRLLMRGATIKQRVERRAKRRGPNSLCDLNKAEISELHEMLGIVEELCAKMEKYQLH
jgi:hypothetical protein